MAKTRTTAEAPADDGGRGLRVRVGPLAGPPLVRDYLADVPAPAAFYAGHPHRLSSYRAKLAEVAGRFDRAARARAAAALTPSSPRAAERLRRFVEEGGAMVTTGQQTGLFGGPLYTVSKALSAVRLAEALEEALGIVVLPVFWCASEDADFAEVAHVHAVDPAHRLRRFSIRPTDPRPLPMSEMRLGPDVESAREEYMHLLRETGDVDGDLASVLDGYRLGETVGAAFHGAMRTLLAPFDALLADSADPALKAASASVLLGEAEHAAAHERAVREATEALEAAGYAGQVTLVEESANLFYHGAAGRERLHREGDALVAKEARRRFTPAELADVLGDDPRALSPNVFLRPVVESAVFPTLAYVGGPAETAYFAQVGPLFRAFGIRPPVVFPRFSVDVVPDDVEATMRRLDTDAAALRAPEHEIVEAVARRRLPPEVQDRLAELRTEVVGRFGALMDAARGVDANLDAALGARRNRALLEVAAAERKILRHLKRRDGLPAEVAAARNHVAPTGQPAERVLNVLPSLARDPALLQRMADGMQVELADD